MNRKNIYVFGVKGVGAVVNMLMTWAVSSYLGAEGAGVFFITFSLVSVLAIISRLGFDNIALRETALAQSAKKKGGGRVFQLLLIRVLVVSVIFSVIFIIGAKDIAAVIYNANVHPDILVIMCLAIFPIAAYHLSAFALQGTGRPIQFSVVINLLFPLGIFVIVVSMGDNINLLILAVSVTLVSLAIYIYSRILLWSVMPVKKGVSLFKPLANDLRDSAKQFFTISVCNLSTSWLLILILGVFMTPGDVGIYNAAFRLSLTISFFLLSVIIVAAPKFALLYAKQELQEMERYARKLSQIVFMLSLVPISLMLLMPGHILSLFGTEFSEGRVALQILAAGQLVNIGVGPVQSIINMTRNEQHLKRITIETSLLGLLLAVIGIPLWGIEGAALAYATAISVQNIRSYQVVKKELGIRVCPFSLA